MKVDAVVLMAGSYALFLLAVAYGLDLMARLVAARSSNWRTSAFRYHASHDAWICPNGEWLQKHSFDAANRVMRYRARARVCNTCALKAACTTSDHGREITRDVDPWPHSEAGRFHRGMACAVALLGVAIPVATLAARHGRQDTVLLVATSVVVALAALPLAAHLRGSPSGFPNQLRLERHDSAL